jgi:hypothetical protein
MLGWNGRMRIDGRRTADSDEATKDRAKRQERSNHYALNTDSE